MWREAILGWTDAATFTAPAPDAAIRACEAALGHTLPSDLADLLRESNGVEGEHGLGLIWPVERITEDNLMFRTQPDFAALYMPFDPLLFFADASNGDQFAFVMRDRQSHNGGPEPDHLPGLVAHRAAHPLTKERRRQRDRPCCGTRIAWDAPTTTTLLQPREPTW